MASRESLIYSEVRAWLTINQRSAKWLAREVGMSYPTMMAVLTGRTKNNLKAKRKIVKIIDSDPWKKYPILPYPKKRELQNDD